MANLAGQETPFNMPSKHMSKPYSSNPDRESDAMIQYRNGRFHIPGMSFIVPDGFYLNTTPDTVSDNCLCLISPNKEYSVFIQAASSKGSTFEELRAILINAGEHTLVPESITINGIHGHHVKYTAGNERYYELRFRNPFNHQEYAQLTILISCPETCNDFPTKETHAIDSLIAGIRLEPIT